MTKEQIILAKIEGCRKLIEELKSEFEEIQRRIMEIQSERVCCSNALRIVEEDADYRFVDEVEDTLR